MASYFKMTRIYPQFVHPVYGNQPVQVHSFSSKAQRVKFLCVLRCKLIIIFKYSYFEVSLAYDFYVIGGVFLLIDKVVETIWFYKLF